MVHLIPTPKLQHRDFLHGPERSQGLVLIVAVGMILLMGSVRLSLFNLITTSHSTILQDLIALQ
jgi:hypothetical protein